MKITFVERQYENKVFPKGQFKQFALKLARFCNLSLSVLFILLHRKSDDFETSTICTVDDLMNICEIGKTISCLAFHSSSNIIKFSFQSYLNALNITYAIKGDMENAKHIIFLTENTLELTRLSEQGTGELTLDNSQSIGQTQMDSDLSNILIDNESTNSLVNVWQKALNQLQSLYSIIAYQTWIVPIVPSVDGNQLILECPDEFAKDWIESRYKKDIIETVRSIEPSVEGIIVRVIGNQSDEATNKWEFLEIEKSLFDLMRQVYEKETENWVGSFDKYFNQVIKSHLQERIDDYQNNWYEKSQSAILRKQILYKAREEGNT